LEYSQKSSKLFETRTYTSYDILGDKHGFSEIYVPMAHYYRWIMDTVEQTGVAEYDADFVTESKVIVNKIPIALPESDPTIVSIPSTTTTKVTTSVSSPDGRVTYCPEGWTKSGRKCYYISNDRITLKAATDLCKLEKAQIFLPKTHEDLREINRLISAQNRKTPFFIGASVLCATFCSPFCSPETQQNNSFFLNLEIDDAKVVVLLEFIGIISEP